MQNQKRKFSTEFTILHTMVTASIQRNMKRAPLKRTSIFLTSSQRAQLAQRSEETGAPAAELIRRAIDQYLAAPRQRKEMK